MSPAGPRIAYFSPIAPDLSGVADYSEELLPHLARHVEIDLFVDGGGRKRTKDDTTAGNAEVGWANGGRPAAEDLGVRRLYELSRIDPLPLLPSYDAVLYHIGNSASHRFAYTTLQQHRGLVILHDLALYELVIALTRDQGRDELLFAEMRYQHGDGAAEALRRAWYAHAPSPWEDEPLRYPLNQRVLERALGVLVHSEFVRRRIAGAIPDLPVTRLHHHAAPSPDSTAGTAAKTGSPASSGRRHDRIVFVSAGFLSPGKRIATVARALASIAPQLDFEYRLVGEVYDEPALQALINELGLAERVVIHGRVDKTDLYRHLREADVCVNLRYPNHGETSGIVMRALASGRPVVVSESGWFAELPDACALKIGRDADIERLSAELLRLGTDKKRRASMGAAAAAYAAAHDLASRARGYIDFIARSNRASATTQTGAGLARAIKQLTPLAPFGGMESALSSAADELLEHIVGERSDISTGN